MPSDPLAAKRPPAADLTDAALDHFGFLVLASWCPSCSFQQPDLVYNSTSCLENKSWHRFFWSSCRWMAWPTLKLQVSLGWSVWSLRFFCSPHLHWTCRPSATHRICCRSLDSPGQNKGTWLFWLHPFGWTCWTGPLMDVLGFCFLKKFCPLYFFLVSYSHIHHSVNLLVSYKISCFHQ